MVTSATFVSVIDDPKRFRSAHQVESYLGLVPRENIMGKPLIIWWSFEASTEHLASYSVDQVIHLVTHFFQKTRWSRTLQFIRAYPLGY